MINIEKIIENLLTNTSLTDKVWNRIYRWSSPNETEDWLYICINIVSDRFPTSVEQNTRLEFRVNSHNQDVQFVDLQEVDTILFNHLTNINNLWNLWATKFVPLSYIEWYWENWYKQWFRDYSYYWDL